MCSHSFCYFHAKLHTRISHDDAMLNGRRFKLNRRP